MKIKVSPKKVGLITGGVILTTIYVTLMISAISYLSFLDALRTTLVGEVIILFILAYISLEKEHKNVYAHGYIYGFGQTSMSNPTVTRELIKRAKEKYKREKQDGTGVFLGMLAFILLLILFLITLI